MTPLEILQARREKVATKLSDIADRIEETALGKKRAAAEAELAQLDTAITTLQPPAPTPPAPNGDPAGSPAPAQEKPGANREDAGPIPGFLDRSKAAANG